VAAGQYGVVAREAKFATADILHGQEIAVRA
jgi:hypothetical protein